jgi:hypothetical protein
MKMLKVALSSALMSLALVATAAAAAPVATTSSATAINSGDATLVGTVDPNTEATTYYFEYGTTQRFGSRTADGSAGNGANARQVRTKVEGLAPNTKYFFRLVASNRSGVDSGQTRNFKTDPQPLGLQISATPNPVTFGIATTVVGTLTGNGNANKQVQLEQNAFPFTAGFANVGNPVVTRPDGTFGIPVLPLPSTTQFRVHVVNERPPVVSPIITLGVAARVRTATSRKRVRRNRRVTIGGTVQPARLGIPFEVQKQTRKGEWVVVKRGLTRRSSSPDTVRYAKRVRVVRTAKYRVFVNTGGGDLISGFGPELAVTVRKAG